MRVYSRGRSGGVSLGPVATIVLGSLFLAVLVSVWLLVAVVAASVLAVAAARSLIEGYRKLKAAYGLTEGDEDHADDH